MHYPDDHPGWERLIRAIEDYQPERIGADAVAVSDAPEGAQPHSGATEAARALETAPVCRHPCDCRCSLIFMGPAPR